MERRFTFGEVSDLYGAARPNYPDSLFDDVVEAGNITTADTILEIGCGTGQATQNFARRGISVVAVDPGPKLLRLAQEQLAEYQNVQFVELTFEAWQPVPSTFKMVVAAQALHWVAPEFRFSKPASILPRGGTLAVFGNVPKPVEPLQDKFVDVYARFAPALLGPPPEAWYLPNGPFAELLEESEHFASPVHKCYSWSRVHTASSYTDLLRTFSSYQMLEGTQREAILEEISSIVTAHGGQFELPYESHLYIASRK